MVNAMTQAEISLIDAVTESHALTNFLLDGMKEHGIAIKGSSSVHLYPVDLYHKGKYDEKPLLRASFYAFNEAPATFEQRRLAAWKDAVTFVTAVLREASGEFNLPA